MVVDGEWRLVAHQQSKHRVVAVNYGKLVVEKHVLAYLRQVRSNDVTHTRQVHQFRLFAVHKKVLFVYKDNLFC